MIRTSASLTELRLKGTPVCRGVAIGRSFFFSFSESSQIEQKDLLEEEIEEELIRYRRALEQSRLEIEKMKNQMEEERVYQGAAILEAHLQMLEDPLLTTEVEEVIIKTKKNAEAVFHQTVQDFKNKFDAIQDPFFRERFKDIQDVARRVISHLRHTVRISLADVPIGSIIFTSELSASEAAEADPKRIYAFVTELGGMTTHAAILAKAKGIPYIARVPIKNFCSSIDAAVIVDGRTGEVIIAPQPETLAVYSHIQRQLAVHVSRLEETAGSQAKTHDGLHVRLSANVEVVEEISLLHQYQANGIGLLRSENIFLFKEAFPNEEEQYRHYRAFIEEMRGLPIVIRTFDIGADKNFLSVPMRATDQFFMGCRAIQFLLQEKIIFKRQLRAILRAAAELDTVSVLFPMITSLSELREAKEILNEAKQEVAQERSMHLQKVKVGCMIEVPAAVLIADLLAKECDFFSIGTNDLTHYSLAIDRTQQSISSLTTLCHPSLLRLIKMVVVEANRQGIPVCVCGEIASDPRFTPLLLGLGVHELSVASRYIPLVKHAIRSISSAQATELACNALKLPTSLEVQHLLTASYRESVPEDCFYNF